MFLRKHYINKGLDFVEKQAMDSLLREVLGNCKIEYIFNEQGKMIDCKIEA